MIVPTGIGATIGGYAGDANSTCKQLAAVSDILITHPNVVNAAMFTDIAPNILVLEGALLDMFFQEKITISSKRTKHRIAVVMDSGAPLEQREITQNVISAAIHVYGADLISEIFFTDAPVAADLERIGNPETLLQACTRATDAGATALALVCLLPDGDNSRYINAQGADPIGLIEAQISHLVSSKFLVPSAHAPVFSRVASHQGLVAPRVAAEYLGFSYLPSIIKCLEAMPVILSALHSHPERSEGSPACDDIISARDLRHLIVPHDSCDGIPMHAAQGLGVELITIRENTTVLDETTEKLGLKHSSYNTYADFINVMAGRVTSTVSS
jgi:hypothetical protein